MTGGGSLKTSAPVQTGAGVRRGIMTSFTTKGTNSRRNCPTKGFQKSGNDLFIYFFIV
jgi:hypothetical protein